MGFRNNEISVLLIYRMIILIKYLLKAPSFRLDKVPLNPYEKSIINQK